MQIQELKDVELIIWMDDTEEDRVLTTIKAWFSNAASGDKLILTK